jgi:cobalt-zinc-cadmium efflux system outer membrane protein
MARLLVALALVLAAGSAGAQPLRLSLAEAMRRAEQHAPTLGPKRAALAGARGVRSAADTVLPTPPRMEVDVGPRWRSQPREVGLEASVGLWQDLSLGGYGGARKGYARALEAEARARLDVGRRDAKSQAAMAWIDARLARELLRIRSDSLKDALEIERIAAARVRAGSTAPSEHSLARALVGRARADLLDARGRGFVADADLRTLIGAAAGAKLQPVGALDARDGALDRTRLLAWMRQAQPDIAAAQASAVRSARAAELVESSGRPFIAVGPQITREATGDWLLLGRVSFPLPVVNPAAVEAARSRSEALTAHAEVKAARTLLEHDTLLALEEREHSRELRNALRDGAIGPAREALRQTKSQYQAGSVALSAVLEARRELLLAQERWAEAAADVRRADIALARIVGREPWQLQGRRP